ncbi:DUF4396 domain-containing protein [Pseudoxanthomonas sp. JBR18]|uniref:DUF4396 domain-containing protein n=1 Tax=Pseudoxanthomonas sp. JBR18 TaxID=2969308 RepID=UPI00230563A4|nr:DUF4396 domain-containing protein [Pseudoxanthomonas sp. JBR18]WCE04018.1 DUF4396 domain-containing protein [Pseudoxanthomonas sp. JBR18]
MSVQALSPWGLASLLLAAACVGVVVVDIFVAGYRQHMAIMEAVWPLTMLWAGPVGLLAYFAFGRGMKRGAEAHDDGRAGEGGHSHMHPPRRPRWQSIALGASHCGAGCVLADVIAESATAHWPLVLWGNEVFGGWLVALLLAYVIGIVFQYFAIAPMRGLGLKDGLVAAIKADTASLLAWQVGMYGFMALALFVWWSPEALPKDGAVFWWMMQFAMCAGFVVAYPVNAWLIRAGIKEAM